MVIVFLLLWFQLGHASHFEDVPELILRFYSLCVDIDEGLPLVTC